MRFDIIDYWLGFYCYRTNFVFPLTSPVQWHQVALRCGHGQLFFVHGCGGNGGSVLGFSRSFRKTGDLQSRIQLHR